MSDADVIPLDTVRRALEIERRRKERRAKMVANCGRSVAVECGARDPETCLIHGPLLPEIR